MHSKYKKSTTYIILFLIFWGKSVFAQPDYQPSPSNLQNREAFQDKRFGLFIHWGIYSLLMDGEWVMNNKQIPIPDYEKLAPMFNPIRFNAADWVKMVKEAGMKYITITSKHHDGFAMFDSKLTDYDIVDRTPFKRDILKELAEACKKEGIQLFFYHSHLDWHHPEYFPRGKTGLKFTGRPESGDFNKYLDFMDGQLKELCSQYGEIGGIWFDGWWDKPDADWRLEKTYKTIHDLQPQALVGNNHHRSVNPGEDFQMFEKDLPGKNTTGFADKPYVVAPLPLETCETMNNSWGFNLKDTKYKTSTQLIHYLVKAAGNNANFLLNVGPAPDGTIQKEFADTLRKIGSWLNVYGKSIYQTRGGPIAEREWGTTTQKTEKTEKGEKKTVYFHILKSESKYLAINGFKGKIKSLVRLDNGQKVPFFEKEGTLFLGCGTPIAVPDLVLEVEVE
jgi:alpha-L-fucosidase